MTLTIRLLLGLGEMHAAVDLQRLHWGDDVESVIPAHMLFSLAGHGGHVLAAFDGARMVGVLIGFIGTGAGDVARPAMANLQIVSKRMVIHPEYRGQGIGYRLKLAQRDRAMAQGIRLVEWTFDPLLAPNAHLNIRKLGAVCTRYLENYYGTEGAGGLAALGASDRLLVEWWVTHRRVEERLTGKRGLLRLAQYLSAETPLLNPTDVRADGLPVPAPAPTQSGQRAMALIEIPADYTAMMRAEPALAVRWREHSRRVFTGAFARGFMVTDFLHENVDGRERAFYLMSYDGPQPDSIQPGIN